MQLAEQEGAPQTAAAARGLEVVTVGGGAEERGSRAQGWRRRGASLFKCPPRFEPILEQPSRRYSGRT